MRVKDLEIGTTFRTREHGQSWLTMVDFYDKWMMACVVDEMGEEIRIHGWLQVTEIKTDAN